VEFLKTREISRKIGKSKGRLVGKCAYQIILIKICLACHDDERQLC
jgi:hypothetical protein